MVEHGGRVFADPRRATVPGEQPVVDRDRRAANRVLELGQDTVAVVGMQQLLMETWLFPPLGGGIARQLGDRRPDVRRLVRLSRLPEPGHHGHPLEQRAVPCLGLCDRLPADALPGAGAADEEHGKAESNCPAHCGHENPRPLRIEQDEECSGCPSEDQGCDCDKPETGAVLL